MRSPILKNLILDTLELLKRLCTGARVSDVVIPRFHPWVVTYVEYEDGGRGCGICAAIYRGMFGLTRRDVALEVLSKVRIGDDAFDIVRKFIDVEVDDIDRQVMYNAIAISTLNALSHRFMCREFLESRRLYVYEHTVGDMLFGNRIGMALQRVVKPSDIVAIVGYLYWAFPFLVGRVKEIRCLELLDKEMFEVYTLSGTRPRIEIENDPEKILSDADVVIITGMTIPNETLPYILKLCKSARLRVLYGPSCSFYPIKLFELGIDAVLALRLLPDEEIKRRIIDTRGLHPYEEPTTALVEIWRSEPPSRSS